jgi:hypothetical protein
MGMNVRGLRPLKPYQKGGFFGGHAPESPSEGPPVAYVHAYRPAAAQGGAEEPGSSASTTPDGQVNRRKAQPCLKRKDNNDDSCN